MSLTFNMNHLVRERIPASELIEVLTNNLLDHAHPLHLNVKYPKHPLCVVVETISTPQVPHRWVISFLLIT